MSNILFNSIQEIKEIESLLSKNLPHHRKAYSDRSAWLMACISELAYIKFNPLFKDTSKDYFIKQVSKLVDNKRKIDSLNRLIKMVAYDSKMEEEKLKENVDFLGLELEKFFDNNGTQAILLKNDNHIFLGFRGTEPTNIRNIITDLKASTVACESGGRIHLGFSEAFNQVSLEIQQYLDKDEFKNKPLFITGHSSGGALAIIASKQLTHCGGIAACYTFGSPRVGDMDWTFNIKTPIYRLINAADPVTTLPPGAETIGVFAWLFGFIPRFGKIIKRFLLSKFGGYYHTGDTRYLTNCIGKNYKKVRLLYAVSIFFRLKAFIVKKLPFLKILADHSISIYRKKLKIIACNRNNIPKNV